MKLTQWALVDIETNGSSAKSNSITEIAIIVVDNWRIVESWQTLVKPSRSIPYQIEQLTGISNAMVANAPAFADVADAILNKLAGRLFIAHNARFDYAFIKNAFLTIGKSFSETVLCTVKLSRGLYPHFKRHNMDTLVARFHLKAATRHRAMADAELMFQFLHRCCNDFGVDTVMQKVKELSRHPSLPSYLTTSIDEIPETSGVYLFYGETKALPIYIGKSINLKKRILSHFSSDYSSSKELKLSQQVRSIDWIETAGELSALLLESKLIKEKMPIYNQRLRRVQFVTCFHVSESDGYKHISLVRANETEISSHNNLWGCFKSKRAAETTLRELVSAHQLCPKLCGLDNSKNSCFHYQLKKCKGACLHNETSSTYNLRVDIALNRYKQMAWPFAGVIGIKEYSSINQLSEIHLLDQWQYLGSVSSETELDNFFETRQHVDTTIDDIKIIQSFLTKTKKDDIIEIGRSKEI